MGTTEVLKVLCIERACHGAPKLANLLRQIQICEELNNLRKSEIGPCLKFSMKAGLSLGTIYVLL